MLTLDFNNLTDVLNALLEVQGSEKDMRQACRDAKHFITKRDGQWEPYAIEKMDGRYRGTFDMCGPIIDNISGEIKESDFTIRSSPAGGESTEDLAKTYDGLIRNIRNISNAETVFNQAGRSMVIGGFDAWEVVQDYADADSFDQDLFIKRIPNAVDNVWFDGNSKEQDASDAMWVVVMTALTKKEYDRMFPKGSGMSVGDDRQSNAYWQKMAQVNVGRILYKKPVDIELALMSNGAVYKVDEDYEKVKDELAQQGITETRRRTRKSHKVHSRLFDGQTWLEDEEETVFIHLPVVPVYGNFDIIENKRVYYGKIEKLYDQQRSLNYLMSRDIEDGALSPAPFYWITTEQAQGHDYSRMNVDNAPMRFYNPDAEAPGTPQWSGGVQIQPGLQAQIASMQQMISATANSFNAQQGNASPIQSGVAGAQQIDQGNTGNIKWFKSLEIAICYTGKVLLDAIPKVYDSTRQVRILNEDGTGKMVTLNQSVTDQQSGQIVTLNDLSQGTYDAVCNVGPAFNNQQKETAQAFLEMSNVVPGMADIASDVWVGNLQSPGMDQVANRLRKIQMANGNIPEEEWTDEERQEIAEQQALAAQQPPQEDPNMVLARAEEGKALAEQTNAQTKQMETQAQIQLKQQDQQIRMAEIQLKQQEFERAGQAKFNTELIKSDQEQQKIDLQANEQRFNQMLEMMQQQQDSLSQSINDLKVLREAMGVDAVVSPQGAENYQEQTEIVNDKQENQDAD